MITTSSGQVLSEEALQVMPIREIAINFAGADAECLQNLIAFIFEENEKLQEAEDKIEELEAQLNEVSEELKSEIEMGRIFHDLAKLITPEEIDLIRCGIGSNYSGNYYEQKIEQTLEPIRKAYRKLHKEV